MCKKCVEYKSFDELPDELRERFKSGAKGKLLDKAKDGYVDFISHLNQRGDELVGVYVGVMSKTQVEFGKCGHVAVIAPNSYKRGNGCGVCDGKQVLKGCNDLATTHDYLAKEWHRTKNCELTPYDITQGSAKKIWWRCREHGHEWEAAVKDRVEGNGCPYCSNKKVLKGFNDIATTHPQYIKYFADIEDAYTHTYGSGKVKMKCPDCYCIKIMKIDTLTRRGFSCDLCSDGISFCEKLMASILTKLNVDFIKQLSYDKGGHKYDFFLPKYNTILETHGRQHYEQTRRKGARTLEKEQSNDKYKRELAISNGILNENYHEIDCRYSTLEWCRPNIEKTLSNYIDMSILTDEDWKQVDIQAQKSLKIEVCNYWKENKKIDSALTTQQVTEVFGVGRCTVYNYLKWGNVNGFCIYDAKEEREVKIERESTFVHLIKPNGDKWFEKPLSMKELSRQTGISPFTIKSNLDKGALKYHHNSKYDPKYIGSRIVSADVYDSQTQSN